MNIKFFESASGSGTGRSKSIRAILTTESIVMTSEIVNNILNILCDLLDGNIFCFLSKLVDMLKKFLHRTYCLMNFIT